MLEDIAILTGDQALAEEIGVRLEKVTLDDLGRAERVTIDKDTTTFIDDASNPSAPGALGRNNEA